MAKFSTLFNRSAHNGSTLSELRGKLFGLMIAGGLMLSANPLLAQEIKPGQNPLFRNLFTADPATMIVGDTLYLYVGHDEAKGNELFTMTEWLCYSTQDMRHWKAHGRIIKPTDFEWVAEDSWACQVIQKGNKFYFYGTVRPKPPLNGRAIGVAVSDSPTGPFVDARGSALVSDSMTPSSYWGDDIDPTILIDDDGTPWMSWGNGNCYLAKLKPNMIELDGPIQRIHVPNYTEGPWLHKRGNLYYLTYAAFAHQGTGEKICYATAPSMAGPWTYRGILTGYAKNSYTIHPAVVEFKGRSYLFYHNADLTLPNGETGATGRRAVCAEYLYYNPDGTMQPVEQTVAGLSIPPTGHSGAILTPPAPMASDPGVKVVQHIGAGARSWPDQPQIFTVDNPDHVAAIPTGFNSSGGVASMGQTFAVDADLQLNQILLFAGDGTGTDATNPVTLALYDLGTQASNPVSSPTYSAGENLLGQGKGLKIGYEVQAPGLLAFNISSDHPVTLKAGHRYALELQGERRSLAIFWRRTRNDTYKGGCAYLDRKMFSEKNAGPVDFSMALYGSKIVK